MPFTITADSFPVYDQWGWDEHWGCDEWQTWGNLLIVKYDFEEGCVRWATAWAHGSFWGEDVPTDCRSTNTNFIEWLNDKPICKKQVYEGITGWIAQTFGDINQILSNALDVATNIIITALRAGEKVVQDAAQILSNIGDFAKTATEDIWLILGAVAVTILAAIYMISGKETKISVAK